MKGKRVRLGEVCEVNFGTRIRSKDSASDKYPVYGGGGKTFGWLTYNRENACVVSRFAMSEECVRWVDGKFFLNDSGLTVSSVSRDLDQHYLDRFLLGKQPEIYALGRGCAQRNLQIDDFKALQLPLPPLSAQRKIAEELDRICALKRAAEKVVEKLGVLAKAKFVEMFGDVKSNSKKFPCELGRDLFCFASGKFLPPESRLESGIPVYGGNGIAWYTSHALISGRTIAIGRVGAYCGNPHKIDMPSWITDNAIYIKKFKTNNFVLEYLYVLMREYDFSRFASKSGQPKITQRPLEEAEYILPPLPLQRQFAAYVGKVEKIEAAAKKVVEKLDVLYRAKLQEYFA